MSSLLRRQPNASFVLNAPSRIRFPDGLPPRRRGLEGFQTPRVKGDRWSCVPSAKVAPALDLFEDRCGELGTAGPVVAIEGFALHDRSKRLN